MNESDQQQPDADPDVQLGTPEQVRRLLATIGHGGDGKPTSPGRTCADEEDARAAGQRVREHRKDRLRTAWHTVPESFRWARFDDLLRRRIKPALLDGREVDPVSACVFDVRNVPSMLLMGPSESGKTSLAAACIRHMIDAAIDKVDTGARSPTYRQGCGVMFVTAYDLAKAQIYSRLGRRPEVVEDAIKATVLVLDELGMDVDVYRQSATSVREVIHERHSHRKPTILTTYMTKRQLQDQYGQGIANRLSKFKVVLLGSAKETSR